MSSLLPFAGSKRKQRLRERDARKGRALQRRLDAIFQLAQSIRDEAHLRQILGDCADDAQRIEILKLLEPVLPFDLGRVQLVHGDDKQPLIRLGPAPLVVTG